jgi:flagellar motor switch protein FliM
VALKLAGIVGNKENLQSRLRDYRTMVTLSFKFFFDGEAGFAKIHVPTEWVHSALAQHAPLEGPALSRSLRRVQELVSRVAAVEVPLQVEVGRVPFGLADLESIEPGDIVLIEGAQVQLADEQVTGPVRCQIGEGKHGFIEGTLMVGENGAYEVVIEQIVALAEPAEAGGISSNAIDEEYAMTLSKAHPQSANISQVIQVNLGRRGARGSTRPLQSAAPYSATDEAWGYEHSDGEYGDDAYGDEAEDEEPLPESAAMLSDVSVPMVVEMGRVKVSASDIVGLRPGQVIELSRSPGDAVDLVVDGRRIGRGELVDIEGELGVRILDLAR